MKQLCCDWTKFVEVYIKRWRGMSFAGTSIYQRYQQRETNISL